MALSGYSVKTVRYSTDSEITLTRFIIKTATDNTDSEMLLSRFRISKNSQGSHRFRNGTVRIQKKNRSACNSTSSRKNSLSGFRISPMRDSTEIRNDTVKQKLK